jgi:hypothetical protein
VEVRRRMVLEVHPDDNSKKDAERWHRALILLRLQSFVSDV